MQFLKNLHKLSEAKDDKTILPDDLVKEIRKNIKDGASDLDQDWDNALELVHKAYKVAGVEKPSPDMRTAWKQYEEMLQLGVSELAQARTKDNKSWRMSSTVFKEALDEAMESRIKVRIFELGDKFAKSHTVQVKNMEEVLVMIKKQAGEKAFDMNVTEHDPCCFTCNFSYQGIKRPYHIKLQRL